MSPKTISIFVVLAVLIVGGLFFWKEESGTPSEQAAIVPQGAWIEVINPAVFSLSKTTPVVKSELHSGDVVPVGTIVETDKNATANIHLPDGSLLRLDKDTTLTLSESYFDKTSGKVLVRVQLTVGRVWSKVFGLATPDSVWEVKTSNAVATVRGTAFSVSFKNGKSQILGSQHKIAVSPLDPKTKEKVANAEVLVGEHKLIEINDNDLAKQIPASKDLEKKVIDAPQFLMDDVFIKNSEYDDDKIDGLVEQVKKDGGEGEKIREKVLEKNNEKFEQVVKKRDLEKVEESKKDDVTNSEEDSKTEVEKTEQNNSPTSDGSDKPVSSAGGSSAFVNVDRSLKLSIDSNKSYKTLTEGDKVSFSATLYGGDGSKKDVTREVLWKLVGLIGKIDSSGVFTAGLDPTISENGEGFGAVVATYPKDGEVKAIGKTDIINVKMRIEDAGPTVGD